MYRVLKPFELLEPRTVEDALGLLSTYGVRAKVLAGGVDLVMRMRRRELLPEILVSLHRIPELNYIEDDGDKGIRIGALTTLREIELSPIVQGNFGLLCEAIHSIPKVQIKTMGTAVGNLCVSTPASDLAPPLFVLGAQMRIAATDSERIIPIEGFFIDVKKTVLEPDEMVTEILVPETTAGTGAAFLKIGKTKVDIAKVNVAVMVAVADNRFRDVKIALGSVAPTVIRATKAEEALRGEELDEKRILRAAEIAAEETRPITDVRSNAEYRKAMVKVLVGDGLAEAVERVKA